MKKTLLTLVSSGLLTISHTLAQINVEVPTSYGSNQDQVANIGNNIRSDTSLRVKIVQIANQYLRVGLVVALLVVLVVTGAKLMSGKNEDSGTALMNALIAILIAIFSYSIIRLVINLFG